MAITNAYVQSQWEQIKRDIRNGVKEASRETLKQYAKEAMHDIDNQSSYDTDTGNLDESLATGIYENGKRIETLFFKHPYVGKILRAFSNEITDDSYGYKVLLTVTCDVTTKSDDKGNIYKYTHDVS